MSVDVKVHYLKDYQPADFEVRSVYLEFDLTAELTRVISRLQVKRVSSHCVPLVLDGEALVLESVALNGLVLAPGAYQLTPKTLTLYPSEIDFELEICTLIYPKNNTALEGLYCSGQHLCTQCEAQGFRRITYYLDRPDVLSIFTTKLVASKQDFPVLLANGNLVEEGVLAQNKHYAVWHDPHKKPCYLFALVAGDLQFIERHYTTAEARDVLLRIYTEAHHLPKCQHAMDSLVEAMRWDEQRFGLSYDLDRYMIVAVDAFNMGAMENKGLNIFNSKYVLADASTATDTDYEGVEAVIAHEYFHNWTGNRVTCRDWFQLTLKEGLTVFRDQAFSADRLSAAVKRIEDVKRLRSAQFAEDAGPMRHPIQPQSYIEMNNFYTMTVYEKGAEVVRLYQTLLGVEGFRKGMDLYFARHDGQAVTVEDFREAMAQANGVDLRQMQAWYTQAGTPQVSVREEYDASSGRLILHCEQSIACLGEAFEPLVIPLRVGFLDQQGAPMTIKASAVCQDWVKIEGDSAILKLNNKQQTFVFENLTTQPYLSLLRDFSAPVILDYDYSETALAFLAKHDTDSFNRWEAAQRLALGDIEANVRRLSLGQAFELGQVYADVYQHLLNLALNESADPALIAYALMLPDMSYLIEQYQQVDIDRLLQACKQTKQALARRFADPLQQIYNQLHRQDEGYRYEKQAIARRLLKNHCLVLLSELDQGQVMAQAQYDLQANMTDVLAALRGLMLYPTSAQARDCMADFYQRWQHESLVLDKWFALQAGSDGDLALIETLVAHPAFDYALPNRVRSVVGIFPRQNLLSFHRKDGLGYAWLAQQVEKLDRINPQVAARMVAPLTQWRRFDPTRQGLMRQALARLKQQVKSNDVYEVVEKALV
ncbi:MAG: aminopeptidase N [Thiomicrospira sp.]|jgi:aminopeptidase N|nr:aminopeptidase N [Thiomicrospira sp.]